ncbi:MAG: CehA/McbA family metallohydrolase [Pirellulaceae bacterium]|nr:CehA/McbA family metallohydrolase [Pirellulaceae bacterium]
MMFRGLLIVVAGLLACDASPRAAWAAGSRGKLEVRVVDKDGGRPLAARMHLKDIKGRPIKPPKVPFWKDHFVFDGSIVLELPPGTYTFELETGPEYRTQTGYFQLERGAEDTKTVEMNRFVEMRKEGWWSGDLHIHRPPADMELLMRAEDLHVGPVITWWNKQNLWEGKPQPEPLVVQFDTDRFYGLLAGEDERGGGALLFFNLAKPLAIAGASGEYPSSLTFAQQARETPGAHIDAEKPFWWDFPAWVAAGKVDSVGLANNHQQRDGMLDDEAWGKPRDKGLYPGAQGNGRWSQAIYYHLLNCGLRIPPSAGSASGVLPNPVGYNRAYVYCEGELTWDQWWENLRLGRVVVTNGPMLRPRVYGPGAEQDGALPGHVFQAEAGQTVELVVALNLATRDKVEYLEVIQDGKPLHEVRLDAWAKANGKLPPVKFTKSGWMLVRAVTNNPKTFRFASTGPYYVEIGYERRVSKQSAQFFLDWVYERARQIKLDDADQQREVLEFHRAARDFWQKKVAEANAE